MRHICVYCASRSGEGDLEQRAHDFGRLLGRRGMGLVYGGANQGMMGAVADGTLAEGGEVIGILPRALRAAERAHQGLTRIELVDGMHERKARMIELADGFVALPGGLGTLDELFEVWTWAMLGIHHKPVGVLNLNGYWDGLLAFLRHGVDQGLIDARAHAMLFVDDDPEHLLSRMARWEGNPHPIWQPVQDAR